MRISRFAATLAMAAALSLTASPVLADGWGGHGHGYRDDHDDTGWIVGGILGIGLIAALAASSSSKAKREREAREREDAYRYDDRDDRSDQGSHSYRNPGARYGNGPDERPAYSGSGRNIDGAVDACVGELERRNEVKVDTVDLAGREGGSWRIRGRVTDGRDFACAVDGAMQVSQITVTAHGDQ